MKGIEGSVRRAGDRVRVTAQLICAGGRFQWAQNTPQSWRTAIKHFERSVEMDADCGLPHIGLATAHVGLGIMGQMPADTAFPRAEAEALAALELESDIGEAHIALSGVKLFYDWDWEGAYHCAQKALNLSPGSPEVQHLYGMYLMTIGAFDDAVDALRTARCPPSTTMPSDGPFFRPDGWTRLKMCSRRRFASTRRSVPPPTPWVGSKWSEVIRGYAYGRLGRSEDARRMLALLDERAAAEPDVNLDMDRALVYRGLDAFDEMFEQLNRAVDSRVGYVVFLPASAHWDAEVRADPRWDKLLSRIQGTASAAA